MKCIKLTIDEDQMVCKVEDGKNAVTEDTFLPDGIIVKDNKDEICYFTMDEETRLDEELQPWNAYILVNDEDFDNYLKDDGIFFSNCFVYFTV